MQSPNNSKKGQGNKNLKSNPSSPNAPKNDKQLSSGASGLLVAVPIGSAGTKSRGKGRVYLNPKAMRDLRLSVDDAVTIRAINLPSSLSNSSSSLSSSTSSVTSSGGRVTVVTVWPAEVKLGQIELDGTTFQLIGAESGRQVSIAALACPVVAIKKLRVTHISEGIASANAPNDKNGQQQVPLKELLGSFVLAHLAGRYVKVNDLFNLSIYTQSHSFLITEIITSDGPTNETNASAAVAESAGEETEKRGRSGRVENQLDELKEAYSVTYSTLIEVTRPSEEVKKPKVNVTKDARLGYDAIGGLEKEVSLVREIIELPLRHPHVFEHFGLKAPRGVLLYGPPGTGKTLIARVVANELGCYVHTISGSDICSKYLGESEQRLREVFELAQENAPSLIFIDEIDVLAPQREDEANASSKRIVGTLLALMDGMKESDKVVVLAATNQPNALDIALRRAGRFDREVEIGIPSAQARLSILHVYLRTMPHALSDAEVKSIADNTHGYVGADISQLCKQAALLAIKDAIRSAEAKLTTTANDSNRHHSMVDQLHSFDSLKEVKVSFQQFCQAMNEIRPSGMREIMVEIPSVRWDDIGGYERIKQQLIEAVEWPIKFPEKFINFGIKPPRGILLYGPPGCSKTLVAKALATEAGLNFIPVKGPELFSKFVGDSERAIREVFRKARAASPAIVFFDEVDALAVKRGQENSPVQDRMLSQMLNELDGISPLNNVLFLCATNRPDIIDQALMRPGRIDRILYVPPPDKDARLRILQLTTKKMKLAENVDLSLLSKETEGYSGAEIVQLCHEAAMIALRNNLDAPHVTLFDFQAAEKVVVPRTTKEQLQYYEDFAMTSSGGMNPLNPFNFVASKK